MATINGEQFQYVSEPPDNKMKILGRSYSLGTDEARTLDFWRAVIGEFMATFFFLLTCLIGVWNPDNLVAGALGTGLTIAILVQMFNAISGANINPAVTLALFVNGQISLVRAVCYMVAQMLGGIGGAGVVKLTTLDIPSGVLNATAGEDVFERCIPKMASGFQLEASFLEFFFTSMLILQVLRCTDSGRPVSNGNIALSVGLVVVISCFCIIPITGSPVNPARIGGPAIAGNYYDNFGYYMLAEFGASIITPLVYSPIMNKMKSSEDLP